MFGIARAKYRSEHRAWVELSHLLAGRFGAFAAVMSLQQQGDLDLLLRCLEDEFDINKIEPESDLTGHYQMFFSESWIAGCYEVLRAFNERDRKAAEIGGPTSGVSELDEFKSIFTDLDLLRIPIAKFQVAKDRELRQPLPMRRIGDGPDTFEFYDPKDPSRSHIMPKGISPRGSAAWLALDGRNSRQHWIERRELADRLLSLRKLVRGAGELEAEQRTSAKLGENGEQ